MRQPPPVGPLVPSSDARRPGPVVLDGRTVRLEPLEPSRHAPALFPLVHGGDRDDVWAYLGDGPYPSRAAFDDTLARKAAATDAVFLAICDPATRAARGYASYMRIDVPHRVVEVGNVLFAPELQATTAATEAMFLMARHVFEDLGYRRYEWKCNDLNAPSKRAAVRLGFTFEGTFRQHMIVKGRNRDTAWYSMLDTEWPALKAGFEAWLDPGNFDGAGRQKRKLEEIRAVGQGFSPAGDCRPAPLDTQG
jgi:RimJ/RimL family protein N-acetyltransferase